MRIGAGQATLIKVVNLRSIATVRSTSFPGSFILPPPGALGARFRGSKMRGPGKEVAVRIGTGCCFRLFQSDRTSLVDPNLVIIIIIIIIINIIIIIINIIIITLFNNAGYIWQPEADVDLQYLTKCEVINKRTKNIYMVFKFWILR